MANGGESSEMDRMRAMLNAGKSMELGEMEDYDDSWVEMEYGDETFGGVPWVFVMCSTCSGFVMRKKGRKKGRVIPCPGEEVVEVVTEVEKMRDLMKAVLVYGPLQLKEPAEATKEQWKVLRRRRRTMMETMRCPACSRSLLKMCPTCSRSLSEEDKEGSLSKKAKRSSEIEGSGLEEAETEGSGLKEAQMDVRESAGGNRKTKAGGNRKTKMVTMRLDKKCIDFILEERPPSKPFTDDTRTSILMERDLDSEIAQYEVECEFHEYLRRQSYIRGYAEYQMEVSDDEENGQELV